MARSAALYIHVPFCHSKCRYCSFVSLPQCDPAGAGAYFHQLRRELESRAPAFARYDIQSVFIGGGTPSVLPTRVIPDILDTVKSLYRLSPDCEITCEANPDSFTPALADAWAGAGVNRVSLGCQAVQPQLLSLLGRRHTAEQARWAVHTAQSAGLARINLDLIYGVPTQTLADWQDSLHFLLDLGVQHLSAYALSVEADTPLYRDIQDGRLPAPDDDFAADCYEIIAPTLAPYGLVPYEISNFAAPGQQCRHNLLYWQNGVYLGVGPAAHSAHDLDGWQRMWNQSDVADYLCHGPRPQCQRIGRWEEMFESLMLGTRLKQGLDLAAFAARFGVSLSEAYPCAVRQCLKRGWATCADGRFALTERVWYLQNAVLQPFLNEHPF